MAASLRGNYEGGEGRVVEMHRKGRVVIKNDVDVERERERERDLGSIPVLDRPLAELTVGDLYLIGDKDMPSRF